MEEIIEKIYSAVRRAGYEYAKEFYQNWSENFVDELLDKESFYYQSIDENGHPLEEKYKEHMPDQVSHAYYYTCSNEDFFKEFKIEGFSKEERDLVKDEDLFEVLWDGVSDFIEETY